MSSNGTASTLRPSFTPPSSPTQSSPPLRSVTPSAAPAPSSPPSSPSNRPSSADPPSSQPPASPSPALPSSNSPAPPASSAAPPASSQRPASSAPPPASSAAPPSTRVVTAPSQAPSTVVQTSVIVITPTPSVAGETPSVVIITSIVTPSQQPAQSNGITSARSGATPSGTDPAQLQGARKDSEGGLSTGGKTAIAVVIPVVVVALLVFGAIMFWRKRKQRKNNEDERRKEVEEYGFNPNDDPTLPAVGGAQMAEDSSGYRGWGNTQTSSNRKASTTLGSGMAYSDSTSNPGGYASPNSPTHAYSDQASNDPLMNGRRETLDSDGIAALGAAPTANNGNGVHRGPSNASSSYSAANRSDNSGEYPGMPAHNPQDYYDQGYYQEGPYGQNNAYGGGAQPVIRDVSARRNTRIENPSIFPQQGNSGVSTNF